VRGEKREDGLPKYYAVARGKRIGLYEAYYGPNRAEVQVKNFSGAIHQKFQDLNLAIQYMMLYDVARSDICLFREALKRRADFKPDSTASFNEEVKRSIKSQILPESERRQFKIDAIRDSLIQHLLLDGLSIDQVDEVEGPILSEAQTLTIYRGMCELAEKRPRSTIDRCLVGLKQAPFVNIIDFVDTCRTGCALPTFQHWSKFITYTTGSGKRTDLEYARENEFLAPLLQDLTSSGGRGVDPILVRERSTARSWT
jgi:hypothetical protein